MRPNALYTVSAANNDSLRQTINHDSHSFRQSHDLASKE
jgi:hypothetical protein